jgi:hypothetical protein
MGDLDLFIKVTDVKGSPSLEVIRGFFDYYFSNDRVIFIMPLPIVELHV